jgi:hypothetical protein
MHFEDVRQMARSFPGVEEHQVFGEPTLRVGKRFLACIAKIDPDTLCIKVPNPRPQTSRGELSAQGVSRNYLKVWQVTILKEFLEFQLNIRLFLRERKRRFVLCRC